MEIETARDRVMEFANKRAKAKNFQLDEKISLIHIMEELGELSRQIFNKAARPEKYDYENLKGEVCDVILEIMVLSKILNMDLSKELDKKLNELKSRNV